MFWYFIKGRMSWIVVKAVEYLRQIQFSCVGGLLRRRLSDGSHQHLDTTVWAGNLKMKKILWKWGREILLVECISGFQAFPFMSLLSHSHSPHHRLSFDLPLLTLTQRQVTTNSSSPSPVLFLISRRLPRF